MPRTLVQRNKIVTAICNQTTNGALTGDYVCLKNAIRCTVVVLLDQVAGHATAITIEQATDAAMGSTKAITNVVPIWQNADTAATDTLVRATDAVSLTVANDIKEKMIVFDIDPSLLDVANDFDWITVKTAASSEANYVTAIYVLEAKIQGDPPPTAIV